jgi:DAK2 domain fusion protein YloV
LSKRSINGSDFMDMVLAGAEKLKKHVKDVNALNVFPVPDGDTGSNMNMTIASGVEQLTKNPSSEIGRAAEVLSKGLLMGARGNSGVILSQLFRGFAKSVSGHTEINSQQFAAALQQGVATAYQAVVKPVEGTILTVSKEAARHAGLISPRVHDIDVLMSEVLLKAREALARTPEQLPVLKQVGVVDSGGQGLVYIYEGFVEAISGQRDFIGYKPVIDEGIMDDSENAFDPAAPPLNPEAAQSKLATEDIEFRYDMEFFIRLEEHTERPPFNEDDFRRALSKDGDSILIIEDDGIVKVHVHSRRPGDVLNLAMKYGELSRIHLENMRDQHRNLLAADNRIPADNNGTLADDGAKEILKRYGFVAVAMGEGISVIFESLGVDVVIAGGQTMNPSTEDIVNAVKQVAAETVFILPNNSNIILAAEQTKEWVQDKNVEVIPSKSIPQGMAAVLALHENADTEQNKKLMSDAIKNVVSGQVTYAVRDSQIDGIEIKEGDFLGMKDNKIVASGSDLFQTCRALLGEMVQSGEEMITIFSGSDTEERQTSELAAYIAETYPEAELEIHKGGQPLYYYIFSVE